MAVVEGDAREERLQDLRAGHGGPARRHGQRGGALSRGLQKIAAGDGRRHAGGDSRRFFLDVFNPAVAAVHAARTRSLRPLDAATAVHTRRELLSADLLGRGTRTNRRQTAWHSGRRNVLVLQRPQFERGRLSAATVRPAVRHEQRQQLQLLLPSGQRRRAWQRAGQRHRHGAARRHRTGRSGVPDRRQSGQQSSAADDQLDEHPPPRRAGDRHQSGDGNGAGQFPRAQRCAQPAVRHRDRQPVRAAAHRRRLGAAVRVGQANRRDRCARSDIF